uniref:Uncharacterized protein n=1 Tax=Oryza sativa subsp. japonica TaxID=39947 RepID=Q5Z7H2_ORYSJ|nr:hypothetical protein [Oryza sativa Japonica Group]
MAWREGGGSPTVGGVEVVARWRPILGATVAAGPRGDGVSGSALRSARSSGRRRRRSGGGGSAAAAAPARQGREGRHGGGGWHGGEAILREAAAAVAMSGGFGSDGLSVRLPSPMVVSLFRLR